MVDCVSDKYYIIVNYTLDMSLPMCEIFLETYPAFIINLVNFLAPCLDKKKKYTLSLEWKNRDKKGNLKKIICK